MDRRENPLLWYQLFGFTRNRWKRQPLLYGAAAVGCGLVYLLVYQLFTYADSALEVTLSLTMFFMCLTAPLMAYNLFSLEYEKQTWESLALTRLTAHEILWGKWGAALARVGMLVIIFVPLLLSAYTSRDTLYGIRRAPSEFSSYTFLVSLMLLFSWGALLVSLGMWLSFKLKRTISTASTLYAGQVFALVLLPTLYTIFSGGSSHYDDALMGLNSFWDGFAWWIATLFSPRALYYLNPFFVSTELGALVYYDSWRYGDTLSRATGLYYLGWGYTQSLIYLSLAALFAGFTYRGLKIAWRK
ncbi:MAG: ABC transporter permease [Fimbriimonadales bacterium]|nr:ABC transporter permease [Fimbriimonadales bacterium]